MSVRRAEQRRAVRDMEEIVMQAHDRLHKGEVEAAHEFLHALLGQGPIPEHDVAPFRDGVGFDHAFRELCIRFRVRAAYVEAVPIEGEEERARVTAGGDAYVAALVHTALEGAGTVT